MQRQERFHVLVIEDDPDDVFFLQHAFEAAAPGAVRLSVVEDGEAARRFLQSYQGADGAGFQPPDLVLLDLTLPKEPGLEFLSWLRAQAAWRDLPTFVLSGASMHDQVEGAYALGANGYLSKDLDQERLDAVAAGLVTYLELRAGRQTGPVTAR